MVIRLQVVLVLLLAALVVLLSWPVECEHEYGQWEMYGYTGRDKVLNGRRCGKCGWLEAR